MRFFKSLRPCPHDRQQKQSFLVDGLSKGDAFIGASKNAVVS